MSPLRKFDVPLGIALAVVLFSAACAPRGPGPRFDGVGSVFRTDLSARHPTPTRQPSLTNVVTLGRGEQVYHGSGSGSVRAGSEGATASTFEPGDFNLNFQSADVREVVQAILGNALGENYTIDPNVIGTITMSSARPMKREDLVPALEIVLQMVGAVLVHGGDLYRVAAGGTAIAGLVDYMTASPGYGITLIPLEHVSARTLIGLIEGFGVRAGSVRAEAKRNMLILVGNSTDREQAIETVLSFDADWMENQSVAILPLEHTKPETVIPELERLFASRAGETGADVVQFLPMQRLKAVLVVSPRRQMIERARTWVKRLDTSNPDLDADIYVYRVKYRDAQTLAELLSGIFNSGGDFTDAPGALIDVSADAGTAAGSANLGENAETLAAPAAADSVLDAPRNAAVRIQADTANNSLVIHADLETRRQILSALNRIDLPQLQVAINVTMAEIRLTDELRYGVQYFLRSKQAGLGNNKGSLSLFDTLAIGRKLPGFNFVLGSESSPEVIVSAFQGITDVQILSSPSLVVVENGTARFQVGDQIPIVTRSVTAVTDSLAPVSNEISYRDTGIILIIKPRVADNGVVNLDISQEISSVTAGAATLTPTISNRSVESTISVVDGQTVLLGGIIGEQTGSSNDGVPGLSRLPGLGNLFSSRTRTGNRTELIILIRPSVIRGSEDAQHVAEELRARMWRASQAN